MSYLYCEVLELPEATSQQLFELGYTTPRKIFREKDGIDALLLSEGIPRVARKATKAFYMWMVAYVNSNGRSGQAKDLPKTLVEWQEAITADDIDDYYGDTTTFEDASENGSLPTNDVPRVVPKPGSTMDPINLDDDVDHKAIVPGMKLSPNDLPTFNGRVSEWKKYKTSMESYLHLMSMPHLTKLRTKDELRSHDLKRSTNPRYNEQVKLFWALLQIKTQSGTAAPKVMQHKEHKDGVRAWNHLCNYYDNEGDEKTAYSMAMSKLERNVLVHNCPGGFEKYRTNFEDIMDDLADLGKPLDDDLMHHYFTKGIQDRDYKTTIDICRNKSYTETVQNLKIKAQELGRSDSRGPSRYQNNSNTNGKGGESNDQSDDEDAESTQSNDSNSNGSVDNNNDEPKYHRPWFPNEILDQLTPEQRAWALRPPDPEDYVEDQNPTATSNLDSGNSSNPSEDSNTDGNLNNRAVSFSDGSNTSGNTRAPPQSIFRGRSRNFMSTVLRPEPKPPHGKGSLSLEPKPPYEKGSLALLVNENQEFIDPDNPTGIKTPKLLDLEPSTVPGE